MWNIADEARDPLGKWTKGDDKGKGPADLATAITTAKSSKESHNRELANKIVEGLTPNNSPDPQDHLVLYHGTTETHLSGIQGEGLRAPRHLNSAAWPMLTSSKEQAEGYINGRPGGVVLEYHIPRDKVKAPGRTDALLWKPIDHDAYDQKAQAYAVRQPIPDKYLKHVHKV